MNWIRQTIRIFIPAIVIFIAFSCANIVAPEGGPRDEKGPVPKWTKPLDSTLNYQGNEVIFKFDEFIKPGGYSGDVFVSPVQKNQPKILLSGKKLSIKLLDTLLANTTYVITIGTGIQDAHEGNAMSAPIVYAFSTGNQLDSLSIKGKITDSRTGEGLKDYTILLFPENQISGDSIFDVKPIYASITDESGNFGLFYLSRQKYKIYAVSDADKSFSYNQLTESIAISDSPTVIFPDSELVVIKNFSAFLPDQLGPMPKSARWVNNSTAVVDFKEKIRAGFKGDSLKVFVTDTFGLFPSGPLNFSFLRTKPEMMWVPVSQNGESSFDIHFENLFDTLGNQQDTFIRLFPGVNEKEFQKVLLMEPYILSEPFSVNIQTTLKVSPGQNDTMISIRDTSGSIYPARLKIDGYDIRLELNQFPDKKGPKHKLLIMKGLVFENDSISDSTYSFPLSFPDTLEMGSVAGFVQDSAWPGYWIVWLQDEKGKTVRTSESEKFTFANLTTGKYTFLLINDRDKNGYWTPGSLFPYSQSEEIWKDPVPVDIKANWDSENYAVIPVKGMASKGGMAEAPKEIQKKK